MTTIGLERVETEEDERRCKEQEERWLREMIQEKKEQAREANKKYRDKGVYQFNYVNQFNDC